MSAKQKILDRLSTSAIPLALFELRIFGVSENAAATRLSELAREGKAVGTYRKGTAYKEWALVKKNEFKVEPSGQMMMPIA